MKSIEYVTSEQGIKDYGSTHISSFSVLQSVIIMDPVFRLQLGRVLIQLDDQQNIVALQHQHQQVIHQRRLRWQRRWWCRPWLLRRHAFVQFEHLMVELRIEDRPASKTLSGVNLQCFKRWWTG